MICKVCGCSILEAEYGYVLIDGFSDLERWMHDPFTRVMPCMLDHIPYDSMSAARDIFWAMQ